MCVFACFIYIVHLHTPVMHKHWHTHTYIYIIIIYIYIHLSISLSLCVCIYIYTYLYASQITNMWITWITRCAHTLPLHAHIFRGSWHSARTAGKIFRQVFGTEAWLATPLGANRGQNSGRFRSGDWELCLGLEREGPGHGHITKPFFSG